MHGYLLLLVSVLVQMMSVLSVAAAVTVKGRTSTGGAAREQDMTAGKAKRLQLHLRGSLSE